MRFVIAADEERAVVHHVVKVLEEKGHDVTLLPIGIWGDVATKAAHAVASHDVDQAIVMCFTGTGVSIAANKVHGIRAALAVDAITAAGARTWNDANVLALSLRLLSEPIATEILEAWLSATYGGTEGASLDVIERSER
ncbi:RpiB/LacA/LacB family sugar-phosphate isomerase [soil metagenome]